VAKKAMQASARKEGLMTHSTAMKKVAGLSVVVAAAATAVPAAAQSIGTRLGGYEEVPVISSTGSGRFKAKIDRKAGMIFYELDYNNLSSNILQAHIHFGQTGVNGGISVFICTNLGNGPAGTPACPGTTSGEVNGTWMASSVVGPAGQGIAATEFDELVDAIRAGVTYVNVHTSVFPSGEIRGQIDGKGHDKH
jgi:hypothetical protein